MNGSLSTSLVAQKTQKITVLRCYRSPELYTNYLVSWRESCDIQDMDEYLTPEYLNVTVERRSSADSPDHKPPKVGTDSLCDTQV